MASFDDSWRHADTVVVGGGTSGPAVAGLLAERTSQRVLVLEAGPDYGPRDSGRWPADLLDARAPPDHPRLGLRLGETVPGPRDRLRAGARDRRLLGAQRLRGAVGQPADYDGWAASGCTGWTTDELLPLFHAASRRLARAPAEERELGPYHRAVLDAAQALGHPARARPERPRRGRRRRPVRRQHPGRRAHERRVRISRSGARAGRTSPSWVTRSSTVSSSRAARPARIHAIHDGRPIVIEADRVVLSAGPTARRRSCCARASGRRPTCNGSESTWSTTFRASARTCTTTRWPSSTSRDRPSSRARSPTRRATGSCPRSRRSRSCARRGCDEAFDLHLAPSPPCFPTACSPAGC